MTYRNTALFLRHGLLTTFDRAPPSSGTAAAETRRAALFKLSEEGEEEELQMVQRQRLQSLSLHHRIGDRSGAAGLAATLQMMAGVGDGA